MTSTIPTPVTTNFDEIDRVIASLHSHRDKWEQTSIPQRLAYLQSCLDRTIAVADDRTMAACQAKGIDVPPVVGEYALTEEAFCGVLAQVSIESQSTPEFLTKAI